MVLLRFPERHHPDDAVVIRLTAPPVEGAANEGLRRFIAERLGVTPGGEQSISGADALGR